MNPVVSLSEFRAFVREMHDASLDPVLMDALMAAQEQVEAFIGFDLIEFDADVPATIKQCVKSLAMIETEAMAADKEQQIRARVESALRPYRRETGTRAA